MFNVGLFARMYRSRNYTYNFYDTTVAQHFLWEPIEIELDIDPGRSSRRFISRFLDLATKVYVPSIRVGRDSLLLVLSNASIDRC